MILVSKQNNAIFRKATPAMSDPMLPLPGLSPLAGKKVVVKFDGGLLSSDGGILALREIEGRLRVAERMDARIEDPRASNHVTHSMAEIIRFRLLMIAAGYEDGNDADSLRGDPMLEMALDLTPSDRELCSQPTISRLENLPDDSAGCLRNGHVELVSKHRDAHPPIAGGRSASDMHDLEAAEEKTIPFVQVPDHEPPEDPNQILAVGMRRRAPASMNWQ